MKVFKLNQQSENFVKNCEKIGVTKGGIGILQEKIDIEFYLIDNLKIAAANILKQDAISVGADVAVSKETILGGLNQTSALLFGTPAQLRRLRQKCICQDFGLKKLGVLLGEFDTKEASSEFLEGFDAEFSAKTCRVRQIMGVVNVTEDSFNPASRTSKQELLKRCEEFIANGATYIDIGVVSSRPGSVYCGADEEVARVSEVVGILRQSQLLDEAVFSLDSYCYEALKIALDAGFGLVNDIAASPEAMRAAAEFDAQYCLMHGFDGVCGGGKSNSNLTNSGEAQELDILGEVSEFFATQLQKCREFGVKKVVLDVGIGFGKTQPQNLILIKHLSHFCKFKMPLLVGASRKSVVNFYSPSSVEERLAGTLFLHLKAVENGANFIRAHDIFETKQVFDLLKAYEQI